MRSLHFLLSTASHTYQDEEHYKSKHHLENLSHQIDTDWIEGKLSGLIL
jgi:hypothetical protein